MKNIVILTSFVAGVWSSAAVAAETNRYDGYATFSGGYNSIKTGGYSSLDSNGNETSSSPDSQKIDGPMLAGRFSAAAPISSSLAVQVDAVFDRTSFKIGDVCTECEGTSLHTNQTSLAAHVFWRSPSQDLVGLIAQRSTNSNSFGNAAIPVTYYLGGEGVVRAGRASFYGQVAYAKPELIYTSGNGVVATGQIRYLPRDNFMVSAKLGYERISLRRSYTSDDSGSTYRSSGTVVGLKSEYQLKASRFGVVLDGEYRDSNFRYTSQGNGFFYGAKNSMKVFQVLLGVKYNFGAGTLLDRDRSGASLDAIAPLGMLTSFGGVG